MKFRELMIHLADCLGRHQLPIVDDSHDIGEFLRPDALHHDIVKNLVRTVYRVNQCGHLDASIHVEPTLIAIGEIRGQVVRRSNADVDTMLFLDQLDDCLGRTFSQFDTERTTANRDDHDQADGRRSDSARADQARTDDDPVSGKVLKLNAATK